MSSRSRVLLSGTLALILAVAIIAAASLTGLPTPFSSKVINPGAPPGTFSILLTDPPTVPQGVTATYITYNDLALHVSGLPLDSGWVNLSVQGTIDTLGLVNVSQTISSTKVPAGSYNILRFNISKTVVTYQGKNYTAALRNDILTIPIVGGVKVNASQPSAALLDIQPTIINVGTDTAPQFVMNAVAKAAPVPSAAEKDIGNVGHRAPLQSREWFHQVSEQLTSRFVIAYASLSSNSLAVTVRNSNGDSADLRLVVVSPIVTNHGRSVAVELLESAIFLVKPDGTLQQVQRSDISPGQARHGEDGLPSTTGYQLGPSGTVKFSFSGTIITSFGSPHKQNGITPNVPYLITVIGDQLVVSLQVKSG